jgi:chemotaxis protein MotB
MVKRVVVFFFFLHLFGIIGCAGQGTYEKKAEAVSGLSKDLAEMQRRNTDLVRENEELRADISGLRLQMEELDAAKKRLEQSVSSADQSPYQFVMELEKEQCRLREELAKLLRTSNDRVRNVSRIYESFLERMKDEIAEGRIRISELRGTVTIAIQDNALFDGNRMELSRRGHTLLLKFADLLRDVKGVNVTVESLYGLSEAGTDSSVRQQTPWEVPAQRTVVVASFIQQRGVVSETLSAVTRGEFVRTDTSGRVIDRDMFHRIEISIAEKE